MEDIIESILLEPGAVIRDDEHEEARKPEKTKNATKAEPVIQGGDQNRKEKTNNMVKTSSRVPDGTEGEDPVVRIIVDEKHPDNKNENASDPQKNENRINAQDLEYFRGDLEKIKDVFIKHSSKVQVTKKAVEVAVKEHIKDWVLKRTKFPFRRFYKMPSVSIEPTKDPDENHQVEVTFTLKNVVSTPLCTPSPYLS
jgi:hypothetical protein